MASGRTRAGVRPLASVVITNHDYGRFVGAAIDSALNQTYPEVEVVVVDDGSQDDSARVLAGYENRATVVFQECTGQGSACNTGLAHSHGDLVLFLDADDLLAPDAVADATAAAAPGVAKVQWPQRVIDEHGCARGVFPAQPLSAGDLRPTVIEEGPLSFPSAPMSGNAFPRTTLDQVTPIPVDDYRICADSYLNAISPLLGSISTLPRTNSCRRMHGANWSTKPLDRRLADSLAVWRADCRWVRRHLRREGVETIGDWRANPFVRSMDRMAGALEAIAAHVPDGDCFILVGGGLRSGESAVAGRRTMLLDRSASTPTGALPAVERRRMQGASFLAVAWPAFEWLAADGLRAALADRYTCTEETEDVVVFGLTP